MMCLLVTILKMKVACHTILRAGYNHNGAYIIYHSSVYTDDSQRLCQFSHLLIVWPCQQVPPILQGWRQDAQPPLVQSLPQFFCLYIGDSK